MMRRSAPFALVASVSAILLRNRGSADDYEVKKDQYVASEGIDKMLSATAAKVKCDGDTGLATKVLFNALFQCDIEKGRTCGDFTKGGCSSKDCYSHCRKTYNEFNDNNSGVMCKCTDWDDFKTPAGSPCPMNVVQPVCHGNKLYRSECQATALGNMKEGDKITWVSTSKWPEKGTPGYDADEGGAC